MGDTVEDWANKTIDYTIEAIDKTGGIVGLDGIGTKAKDATQGAYDTLSGKKAKEAGQQAKTIADMNADRIQQETDEGVRRLKLAQDQALATTRARAAASGVKMTGSVSTYLQTMEDNFGKQLDWIDKSSASREDITRLTGEYQRQQGAAQGWGTFFSSGKSIWETFK